MGNVISVFVKKVWDSINYFFAKQLMQNHYMDGNESQCEDSNSLSITKGMVLSENRDEKHNTTDEEEEYTIMGQVLIDDKVTVEECGLQENSVIMIYQRFLKICIISSDRRKFSIHIIGSATIADVEKKIQERIRYNRDEHRLEIHGELMDYNDWRMAEYGVSDGSVIKIVERSKDKVKFYERMGIFKKKERQYSAVNAIFSAPEFKTVSIKMMNGRSMSFKVKNVKIKEIKYKIQQETSLRKEEQILIFRKQILNDETSINEFDTYSISPLYVTVRCRIEIFIKRSKEDMIELSLSNCDRIIDLKKSIEEKTDLVCKDQVLVYKDPVLVFKTKILSNDDYQLCQYNIFNNSIIEVTSEITIFIASYIMESIPLKVYKNDKIGDIKFKIHKKTKLSTNDQILVYKERTMRCEDMTLDQWGIGDTDNIVYARFEDLRLERRGVCLVINNETFTGNMKERTGTKVDEEIIIATFKQLGYEIKVYRNVSNEEMGVIFEKTKKYVDRSDKMLITFILSHGQNEGIFTTEEDVFPFKNIWTPFSNENFPKLSGRPKLFFFACCRGDSVNKAVRGATSSNIEFDGFSGDETMVPSTGDIFLGFSSCDDFRSMRNPLQGTCYIRCLCKVIKEHYLWSISDIHQEVQSQISKMEFEQNTRQMPCCENMLTEHAYFI